MDKDGPRIKLRLEYDAPLVLGPGKAQLLRLIGQLGSISAAGRQMGMSYKRAWTLVEEMNAAFAHPLVDSSRGGAGGGGASVTPAGQAVLRHYESLEELLRDQGASDLAAIGALMKQDKENGA
ncbi:winged helix-turn-helix domain-containing protein [Paracoccus benzoatiresistens]|uniref:LysR family transcriptional regulator n=1 Tax=Paracoccus benzoatiresistens TaxID=2997341 RepID=A0ABT4J9P4_9RHOB|nr:LysR family transcriptional regulator [Paracoccus sp. EF6]MCZ0963053.1 LysR family transcriptional regulator [Paracoccus sp. EF6]